jgi:hypothetical protein
MAYKLLIEWLDEEADAQGNPTVRLPSQSICQDETVT